MSALFIKLPEAVNNNSLKKYDEIRFKCTNFTGIGVFTIQQLSYTAKARIIGGGNFCTSGGESLGTEVDVPSNSSYLRFTNASGSEIFLDKKYDLRQFSHDPAVAEIVDFDVSQFAYSTELRLLKLCNNCCYGDIGMLANLSKLNEVKLQSTDCFGNLDDLANTTDFTKVGLALTRLTGDASSLSKNINLSRLYLADTKDSQYDFDELADGMVTNGRNSGTMATYNNDGTLVTYTFSIDGWTKS